jgi:AcrR family transcriptional regulator
VNEAETTASPGPDEIRQTTRASNDPRAVRTRGAITAAVHSLIAEGEPSPSVSQIVRRAGVSRSSFYAQFANLDQLAAAVFSQAFTEIESASIAARATVAAAGPETTWQAVERLVRHVDAHRDFYSRGFPATVAGHDEVIGALAAQLRASIPLVSSPPPGVSVEATAMWIAGGKLAVLRSWLTGQLAGSVEDITGQIMALLPGWLVTRSPVPREPAVGLSGRAAGR